MDIGTGESIIQTSMIAGYSHTAVTEASRIVSTFTDPDPAQAQDASTSAISSYTNPNTCLNRVKGRLLVRDRGLVQSSRA